MKDEFKTKKYKTLEIFQNIWTAEVVKFRLIEEGIDAVIINPNVNYSIGPTILEGYVLQVDQNQFLKALNIYKNTLAD